MVFLVGSHENVSVAIVSTTETRTAATYGDMTTAGPAVTVTTTGPTALVTITARMTQGTNGETCFMGIAVSGAAASDAQALSFSGQSNNKRVLQASATYLITVTAGSNTFTAKYKSSSSTCTFGDRHLRDRDHHGKGFLGHANKKHEAGCHGERCSSPWAFLFRRGAEKPSFVSFPGPAVPALSGVWYPKRVWQP